MTNVLTYLTYPPVLRGFLVLLVAGTFFPLAGVFVLRMNLLPFRFALMHTSLLGAALGLALGLSPLLVGLVANGVLISTLATTGTHVPRQTGPLTAFFMVFTAGLAFTILYKFDVPAMDSLALLWGNIYALRPTDGILTLVFALVLALVTWGFFPWIRAVLFNRDTALTSGVPARLVTTGILFGVGFTIHLVMSLIGALLLDAILILPALAAGYTAKSTRELFLHAGAWGFFVSMGGFLGSLALDIPASSGVTIVGALFLALVVGLSKVTKRKHLKELS